MGKETKPTPYFWMKKMLSKRHFVVIFISLVSITFRLFSFFYFFVFIWFKFLPHVYLPLFFCLLFSHFFKFIFFFSLILSLCHFSHLFCYFESTASLCVSFFCTFSFFTVFFKLSFAYSFLLLYTCRMARKLGMGIENGIFFKMKLRLVSPRACRTRLIKILPDIDNMSLAGDQYWQEFWHFSSRSKTFIMQTQWFFYFLFSFTPSDLRQK